MNARKIISKATSAAVKETGHQLLNESAPVVRTSARAAMRLKRAVDTVKAFTPKPKCKPLTQGSLDRGRR